MKLVIDIGSKYLSFSVFATNTHEDYPILLDFSVQDIEGKNNNLVGRAIQRGYADVCSHYVLEEVTILPRRSSVNTQVVVLEYLNNEKLMKKRLLEQVTLPGNPGEYIIDWVVQDDNPENDYQRALVTSINLEEFKFISEVMKLVGERKFSIASPFANLGILFPQNNTPYLLLQLGHRTTDMYIIKDGCCMAYRQSKSFSGVQLTGVLTTTKAVEIERLYEFKNNATYYDLDTSNATSEVFNFLDSDVNDFINTFYESSSVPISGYTVIGGIGNLDFETFTMTLDMPIKRYYPRLPVANHRELHDNVRNYLYESSCVVLEGQNAVNFTAPKDKSIGQYIKTITTIYETAKIPLYFLVVAIILSMGTNYAQNTLLEDKVYTQQASVSSYQSEIDSLKATVETLQATYNELLDDKQLAIVNYGETLHTLSQVIPQGSFITEVKDITSDYLSSIPTVEDLTENGPLTGDATTEPELVGSASSSGLTNGLNVNATNMLVALEIQGYSNQRVKTYDYALLLKEVFADAVVTSVKADGDIYNFTIHVIINK